MIYVLAEISIIVTEKRPIVPLPVTTLCGNTYPENFLFVTNWKVTRVKYQDHPLALQKKLVKKWKANLRNCFIFKRCLPKCWEIKSSLSFSLNHVPVARNVYKPKKLLRRKNSQVPNALSEGSSNGTSGTAPMLLQVERHSE